MRRRGLNDVAFFGSLGARAGGLEMCLLRMGGAPKGWDTLYDVDEKRLVVLQVFFWLFEEIVRCALRILVVLADVLDFVCGAWFMCRR